jgi:hypothetical protein
MWSTLNTRLAASLMALSFKLDDREPFTHDIAQSSSRINFAEAPGLAMLEQAWRCRDEWARSHKDDPFTYMRKCADAYDWLINHVLYGVYSSQAEVPLDAFATTDLSLACCIVACDYFLLDADRGARRFVFCRDARELKMTGGEKITWMLAYLDKFAALKKMIKQSRLDSSRAIDKLAQSR